MALPPSPHSSHHYHHHLLPPNLFSWRHFLLDIFSEKNDLDQNKQNLINLYKWIIQLYQLQ